jgi:hypothetical protein
MTPKRELQQQFDEIYDMLKRLRDEQIQFGDDLSDRDMDLIETLIDTEFVWVSSDYRLLLTKLGEQTITNLQEIC